jgi:DNA-binding MarR family transcriptional regulator
MNSICETVNEGQVDNLSWGTLTSIAMTKLWELDKDRPLTMWLVFMNIGTETSQSALLKKLGLDKSMLSRWLQVLSGRSPTPDMKGMHPPLVEGKKERIGKSWSLTDEGKKLLAAVRGDVQDYIELEQQHGWRVVVHSSYGSGNRARG